MAADPDALEQSGSADAGALDGVLAAVCVVLLAALVSWLVEHEQRLFPVRYVMVLGDLQGVDPAALERRLTPLVSRGFWRLNWAAFEASVQPMGWVDAVRIRRRWPDGVVVEIAEQRPVARWHDGRLINARGELFVPEAHPDAPALPLLEASERQQAAAYALMRQVQEILEPNGLRLERLRLSERGAVDLDVAGGLSIRLPGTAPLDALQRFLKVMPALSGFNRGEVEQADLRYRSGFAVRLKPQGAPTQTQESNSPQRK